MVYTCMIEKKSNRGREWLKVIEKEGVSGLTWACTLVYVQVRREGVSEVMSERKWQSQLLGSSNRAQDHPLNLNNLCGKKIAAPMVIMLLKALIFWGREWGREWVRKGMWILKWVRVREREKVKKWVRSEWKIECEWRRVSEGGNKRERKGGRVGEKKEVGVKVSGVTEKELVREYLVRSEWVRESDWVRECVRE